jgi:membrane-associated protease RseP (regulator of RpoE activity)
MNLIINTLPSHQRNSNKQSILKRLVMAAILLTCSPTFAAKSNSDSTITPESEQLVKDLQQQIKSTVAAITELESNAGNSVHDLHIQVDLPAKQSPNLGLVLDLESELGGYKVLSVTPGSLANNLNIIPGDIITAINSIEVSNSNKRKAFSELENSSPGDTLLLTVNKNGTINTINTTVGGQYIPSIRLEIGSQHSTDNGTSQSELDETACGTVSVFFTPPESKRLYSAYITKINDRTVISSRDSFRLKPGKHTIYLHELINDPFFKRRLHGFQRAKSIEIDVEVNTNYYLAAKFIRDKAFKQRKGEYWEPVIWKETVKGECEL